MFLSKSPCGYFNYINNTGKKRIVTISGNAGNGKNGNCVPFSIYKQLIINTVFYFSITKTILPSVPPPE